MTPAPPNARRQVLLAVPAAHQGDLAELVQAWQDGGTRVSLCAYAGAMPVLEQLVRQTEGLDAALLIGPPRRAPATALSAPYVLDRRARRVPMAWLPATSAPALRRFAAAAARTHQRDHDRPPGPRTGVALLGQWHRQYLQVVDRMAALIAPAAATFRWTADVILREDLLLALGSGLGLGVYVGHGRPVGWVGYHGMRRHHFDGFAGEPLGALFSLCCRTASRRRTGLSYAESLPLNGVAAASFGAINDTLHTDNTRWAIGLCDALLAGAQTVGELVARAAPGSPAALSAYRLVGDPLAPLGMSHAAMQRAASVSLSA
jgi:hypothetical protein